MLDHINILSLQFIVYLLSMQGFKVIRQLRIDLSWINGSNKNYKYIKETTNYYQYLNQKETDGSLKIEQTRLSDFLSKRKNKTWPKTIVFLSLFALPFPPSIGDKHPSSSSCKQ